MTTVLALNAGSSTIKYRLDRPHGALATGMVERIGEPRARLVHRAPGSADRVVTGPVPDVATAFRLVFGALPDVVPDAVGHRIVHGGDRFTAPTLLDDDAMAQLHALSPLAPLHNPAGLRGVEAARERFPDAPQIGVFDTALHALMPKRARRYSLPPDVADTHRIRRYGFHGISHGYIGRVAAEHLGRPLDALCMVTLHLGSGVSAAALHSGRSVDTSMGMTPLSGLVMGTRGGDVDAGVVFHLHRAGMSVPDIEDLLTHRSGLLGLAGTADLRDVHRRAAAGEARAIEALDLYCYRIRCCVGAYAVALGRLDAVVLTAGVGEHDPDVRARICAGLGVLGVRLDAERNAAVTAPTLPRTISTDDSAVAVVVVATDEEAEIARSTRTALAAPSDAPAICRA